MIDSHTHLDSLEDPDAAIARAREIGVHGIVSIGCGADSIRAALEIAHRHPHDVRIAAGVHPQAAAAFDMSTFDEIAQLARDPLVVAIGETGFDLFRDHGTLDQQDPAFIAQTHLARELDLPLVIHTRAAQEHTLAMLDEHAADLTVILHCYSLGEPAYVDTVLEHPNWICSFAGNVTYPSAQDLRDALALMDPTRVMVETDAPYLTPVPNRGKPNEPAYVQHTLARVAEVLDLSFDEARAATQATAERVYRWVPDRG